MIRFLTIASLLLALNCSAATWYVRPLVTTNSATGSVDARIHVPPTAGVYGLQNGTSYENAFNGFKTPWVSNHVSTVFSPGDTIYVCGLHRLCVTSIYGIGTVGEAYVTGTNLTIRLDHPSDPGTVVGAFGGEWGEGSGPGLIYWHTNADGVMWTTNYKYAVRYQEPSPGAFRLFRDPKTNSWADGAGCAYFSGVGHTNYLKPFDGGTLNGLLQEEYGYRFNLSTNSTGIRFVGGTFIGSVQYGPRWITEGAVGSFSMPTDITWDGCRFALSRGFGLYTGWDRWSFLNCAFETNAYHLYSFSWNLSQGANRLTVSNCTFETSNTQEFPNGDGHAVGIQSGTNHTVVANTLTNIGGTAIELFTSDQPMHNCVVASNSIYWVQKRTNTITGCGGIALTAGSGYGVATNLRVFNNLLVNIGLPDENGTLPYGGRALVSNCADPSWWMNNTIVGARYGVGLVPNSYPAAGYVLNNLISNCVVAEIRTYGTTTPTNCVIDYNLYTQGTQIHSYPFTTDAHSITNAPRFYGANDFRLFGGSQASRGGTNLSGFFTTDITGREISVWPIGAYALRSRLLVTTMTINGVAIEVIYLMDDFGNQLTDDYGNPLTL